ncbi:MAG: glycosyltransferase family 4 protein [Candidatus Omnitrophica bacterium]|nr:glycosyltransferase family 4 protein [Candidatus Omnitrophota bacterium]
MPKIRIVYFQHNPVLGATEEFFYSLICALNKEKFEIVFVCPEAESLRPLVERLAVLDIKTHYFSGRINHGILILKLIGLFIRLKPDIIHFNDPGLDGIIASRLARVPVLLVTYHVPLLNIRYNLKARLLRKLAFKYCGLNFIFVDEYNAVLGKKKYGIADESAHVIYTGIPSDRFDEKFDKNEVFDEFRLDRNCRVIANVARLEHEKGAHFLIDIAPGVIEQFKNVRFFLVGEGSYRTRLEELIEKKGLKEYFIFTGFRKDIPRLMSAFEMLVMPSLWEGLSFAAIEASAMRLPVIATDVGGMRSLVKDKITGFLLPPSDIKALSDSILWLLRHPQEAKQMGQEGRKRFEELFTQQMMVQKTEGLYASLLKKALH